MFGTRLLFNPDIPEVTQFRNRLPTQGDDNSRSLAVISYAPYYSLEDDFLIATHRKSIDQLKDCKEDGFYILFATVNDVTNGLDWWYAACKCNKAVTPNSRMYYCEWCYCHVINVIPRNRIKLNVIDETDSSTFVLWDCDVDGEYTVLATVKGVNNGRDWWYPTCECNKQVTPDSGMYYCENCSCQVVNVVPRYRVKLRVMDQIYSAAFVVWDRLGSLLLKKSCSPLLECVQNRGGPIGQLAEFEELLIEKTFLFKVEINIAANNQFEPSFNVKNISTNESIISKFIETCGSFFATEPDLTVDLSVGDNCLSLEFQDARSSVAKDLMQQFCDGDLCLGSHADNCCPEFTPAKRASVELDLVLDSDMSTTKLKAVKIEKE